MTENNKTMMLQEEIKQAVKLAEITKGSQLEWAFKLYVAGIQFAVEVLMGKKSRSILPEVKG